MTTQGLFFFGRTAQHACALLALLCGSLVALTAHAQTAMRTSEANHYFGNLPTYAAIEGGYFARRGITLSVVTMKGGPAGASALLSRDVDVFSGSADQAVKMRSKGQDVRIIGSISQRQQYAIVIPADAPYKTAQDLKGLTIGVTAVGSATDVGTRAWILAAGMDPERDVRILGLGSASTVVVAFQHKQVQAATASPPSLTKMLETGKPIMDFRDKPYQEQSIVIRGEDLTGARGELMRSYVAAIAEAQTRLFNDDAFALAVCLAHFPEMPAEMLARIAHETIHDHMAYPLDAHVSPDSYDNVVATLLQIKAITRPLPYDDVVDTRFLN